MERRRARNPAYSLRSFGRDLGLSPSILSDLLQGKKGISAERAQALAGKLGLNEKERELFLLSAQASHARKKEERESALAELNDKGNQHSISEAELSAAGNWYHQSLLELTELDGCDHSAEWFAKRLGISLSATKSAIDRLMALGWLKVSRGKYQATAALSQSSSDIPSRAIKEFHEQMLAKASSALFDQDVEEREFQSTSFAFDSTQIKEAKKEIRKFQENFARKFYSGSRAKNSVYQISVQFFRLDQGDKK